MSIEASDLVTLAEEFRKEPADGMVVSCEKDLLQVNGGKTVRFTGCSFVDDGVEREERLGS